MDAEKFVLDLVNGVSNVNFDFVIKALLVTFVFFWIMVVVWVWFDASERSKSMIFKVLSCLMVLIFNIFGLLVYFLIRPKESYEDKYWNDLERKYLKFETAELGNCPACGSSLEPGFIACPNCGEIIKEKCECGVFIDKNWHYCAFCGIQRKEVEEKGQDIVEDVKKENKVVKSLAQFGRYVGGLSSRLKEVKLPQRKSIEVTSIVSDSIDKKDKKKKKKKRKK